MKICQLVVISKALKVPVSAVRNILKKVKEHHALSNLNGRVKKSKITLHLERMSATVPGLGVKKLVPPKPVSINTGCVGIKCF